ncbi:MAG: hypothetical protein JXR84_18890 [Anaerolineae bacterium]|nr:hypothetical protein [Anaerolineae bacterium]
MGVLTAYRGVVEKNGLVRLRRSAEARLLPPGSEVLIIATQVQPVPDLEEQERRLSALSPEEWRRPFDAVRAAWDASEPALDETILSDDELVALVHQAREE